MSVALVAGIVAVRWVFDSEPRLERARQLLTGAIDEKDARRRESTAAEAEDLLRHYLNGWGRHRHSARLLLGCALLMQPQTANAEEIGGQWEVQQCLDETPLDYCTAEDLRIGAATLANAGRMEQADAMISAALKREGPREQVLRVAADLRFFLGRDDQVLEHCRELEELRPQDPYPLEMTARVYERLGLIDKLAEADRKLLGLNPPNAGEVRHALVTNLIELGRTAEARKEFETLRSTAPQVAARFPVTDARLLYLEGRPGDAVAIAQGVLQEKPDDADALLLAGRIHLAQAQFDQAIEVLARLVRLDPTQDEAHYQLGQAYARKGQTEKAQHHLAMHRRVRDLKVKLYKLERQAAHSAARSVRLELATLYEELGWPERAEFWKRAAGQ